ncbi:two-component system, sensor histidine kinase YesM [Anaerovirgula multivorans]|uniref:Two-component system, sensor histidine kinase YesM n=1 Tax=Anaerovirgula multivorans TaxID=312168 RepID=A0A239BIX9_9FIRM|nr:histidine kinase [Anaerovirgula multivorans]SNS07014.1 two-component system, sensor histidine kinase YesM [Anaerovirgula multivorans]
MRISIKMKIIVSILIAFSVLFSIYLYIMDSKVKERVTLLNMDLTNQIIDARGNQISYWLQQRKIELQMMADCIIISDMNEVEAREYIQSVYKQKSDIYLDMGIVKYGGYKLGYDGIRQSISEEKYYKNTLKENASFKVSEPKEKNDQKIVVMLYKVGGVNREIEFLYAEIPLENLIRIASRINVYDGIGEILINNNSIHTDEKNLYHDFIGENHVVFETDIGAARGWSLNYYICEKNIDEINHDMRKSILIFGIILLIIVVILLTTSFASIIKPIDKLKKLMKKVEDGDLSVKLESNRKDEIGSLICSFNNMTEKLEKLSYQKKEMRLRIMQEQIKPHFLYNTLDTIKWAAMEDNTEEVLSLIESLSTYFRIGLSNGKTFITLDEELEHIDSYLRIQKSRYEDQLTYSIHYDDCLMEYMIMRVLLQPIVENAVVHGVNGRENRGEISICITQKNEDVVIKIMNNSEISLDALEEINHALRLDRKTEAIKGYGLYNVNHRIKLEHGEKYGLEFQSQSGWTTVTITIPRIRRENGYV